LSYVTANDQQASQLVDALRRMFDSGDQQTPGGYAGYPLSSVSANQATTVTWWCFGSPASGIYRFIANEV
jgi:hypothetical protein